MTYQAYLLHSIYQFGQSHYQGHERGSVSLVDTMDDEITNHSNQIYLDIKPSIIPIRRSGIEILASLNLRIATSAMDNEIITIDDCDAGSSNLPSMPFKSGNVKTECVDPLAPRKRHRMRPKGQPPVRSSLRLQLQDSLKFGIRKDPPKRVETAVLRNMRNISMPNLNQEAFLQFVGLTSNAGGNGNNAATETKIEPPEIPIKMERGGCATTSEKKKSSCKTKKSPKGSQKQGKKDLNEGTSGTNSKTNSALSGMPIKSEPSGSTHQTRGGRLTRARPMTATAVVKNDPDASIRAIKRELDDTVFGVQTRSMAVRGKEWISVENYYVEIGLSIVYCE